MKGIGIVTVFVLFAFAFLALLVVGYVINQELKVLVPVLAGKPQSNSFVQAANTQFNKGISNWDISLTIAYILILVGLCVWSFEHPSQLVAYFDIMMVFIFAVFYFTLQPDVINVTNILGFNSLFPITTSAWSNNYMLYLTEAALVVSAVFNSRSKTNNPQSMEMEQ